MAGLLGDSWDDPRTQATLQLAAGLLGGGNFGQALGRGLGGYQQSMSAAQEAKMRKEEMDWRRQAMAEKQAQVQEAQRIEGAVRQAAQGGGLNANALIAQGVPVDRVKALFEAQNLGKQKVARTVKGMGPDGREHEYQVDELGNRVGESFAQHKAPIQADLGGRQVFLDPYKLSEVAGMNKSMTPEGRDASARGWAGNAVARDRLAFEQSGGGEFGGSQSSLVKQFGKPSPGYRWKPDGSQEFIPGGPADQKAQLQKSGEGTVGSVVADLRDKYNQLHEGDGVVSTNNRFGTNLAARLGSSSLGQGFGGTFGTQNQSARDSIAMTRPLLLQAIMKATGMSAKQMDSNAELKLYLATATDPKLGLEANLEALDRIESLYGGGGGASLIGGAPGAAGRQVKRSGIYNGRKVIEYTDGTVVYAD